MKFMLLKGGSLSSTYMCSDGNVLFLRKEISRKSNREYGYIRWYTQLKKHIYLSSRYPELFPKIYKIESNADKAYVDMEWLENYVDLKTYLSNRHSFDSIIDIPATLHDAFAVIHSQRYRTIKGLSELYYHEEVVQKINDACVSPQFSKFLDYKYFTLNGTTVTNLTDKLDKLKSELLSLDVDEADVHGNPTLENIMYNPIDGNIKFIDVYYESVLDSVIHDFAMVLQCSQSYYGLLADASIYCNENHVTHSATNTTNFQIFNSHFIDKIPDEYSLYGSKLLEACQFIRLLPFKIAAGKIDHAKFFYVYASSLLDRYL